MLKHIVLYKLKDNSEKQKQLLKEKFYSMKGNVPQLRLIEAGGNIIESERAFDFALICDFDSREDLEGYLEHPFHQKVREYVRSVIEKSHSVDFIY